MLLSERAPGPTQTTKVQNKPSTDFVRLNFVIRLLRRNVVLRRDYVLRTFINFEKKVKFHEKKTKKKDQCR